MKDVGTLAQPLTYSLLNDPIEAARLLTWMVAELSTDEQLTQLQTFAQLLSTSPDLLLVVAAYRGEQRVGAAAAQLLPGRTALVWPVRGLEAEVTSSLWNRLLQETYHRGAILAQALLPRDARLARAQLESHGFHFAGDIQYMLAATEITQASPPIAPLCFETALPTDPRLLKVLEDSYRGSLDCPLIDGWRALDDVIAGYQATGQYVPELWQFALVGDDLVGCLLMTEHPADQQAEVMYLAIRPAYRGRGWGRLLARQALRLAHNRGFANVVLAVDVANAPAVKMYADEGFQELTQRAVLVRRL